MLGAAEANADPAVGGGGCAAAAAVCAAAAGVGAAFLAAAGVGAAVDAALDDDMDENCGADWAGGVGAGVDAVALVAALVEEMTGFGREGARLPPTLGLAERGEGRRWRFRGNGVWEWMGLGLDGRALSNSEESQSFSWDAACGPYLTPLTPGG